VRHLHLEPLPRLRAGRYGDGAVRLAVHLDHTDHLAGAGAYGYLYDKLELGGICGLSTEKGLLVCLVDLACLVLLGTVT